MSLFSTCEEVIKSSLLSERSAEYPDGLWVGTPAYQEAFKTLWGCSKTCPFCHEPCVFTNEGHSEKCRTIQHKPQGIRGCNNRNTNALTPEPCSYDITTDSVYYPQGDESKRFPYKQYSLNEYSSSWRIEPSTSSESCKFWMLFMWKYRKELTIYYKDTNDMDIPDSWGSITSESALESLDCFKA